MTRKGPVEVVKLGNVLSAMKYRCSEHCSIDEVKRRYFDRGITVCDEWAKSTDAFIEWSLSNGYQDGLQIDRIDNDKGYSPENCRWITPKQNSRNRADNSKVRCMLLDGSVVAEFGSSAEASEWIGGGDGKRREPNIIKCCRGRCATAYGYRWEYVGIGGRAS